MLGKAVLIHSLSVEVELCLKSFGNYVLEKNKYFFAIDNNMSVKRTSIITLYYCRTVVVVGEDCALCGHHAFSRLEHVGFSLWLLVSCVESEKNC